MTVFVVVLYLATMAIALLAWHAKTETELMQQEVFKLGGENEEIKARLEILENETYAFHAVRMAASQPAAIPNDGTPG